jgi:transposase
VEVIENKGVDLQLETAGGGAVPRIWIPSSEEEDLRQLLIHRYKLVCLRVQVKNELQHLAMNQGITKKRKLWSKAGERVLRELPLRPWSSRRREDLFRIRDASRPGANRDSARRIMAEVLAVSMVGGTISVRVGLPKADSP